MAIPSLSGSYIDETYQRLVQVSGSEFADGLGTPITFGQTPTGSLLVTASASGNTITFQKGNGDVFNVTVSGGSGDTTGLVTTGSFNSFTSSINNFTQSILNWTGSVVTYTVFNQFTSSYNTGSFTGSFTGSLKGTADTASYYVETDPIYISQKPTLATTGSNIFIGNQTITGSVLITGSTTQIGDIILTGSLLVTQSHISTVDYIDFSVLPIVSLPAHNTGRVHWFDDTKTLQIDTDVNNFMIEIGHQHVVRVHNGTGIDMPVGTVVYISGSQGNNPQIVTASYESDTTSAATIGLVATYISGTIGSKFGYVVTRGLLRNVNTMGYSVGTQLYLSSSGKFTNVAPDAPLHEVRLGKVIVSNATTGVIYVDVMNGYELTELHDVRTNGYTNGDLLIRSASIWTNSKTLSGSYTLSGSLTTNDGVSVQTLTASVVSASQFTGSLFGTASWANNYNESDPIFVAKSASLATTGSNTFIGNQIVSGAVIATGEYITSTFYKVNGENGTLTYIGDDGGDGVMYINSYDLTGSLNINTGGFYKVFDENATKSTQILFYEPPSGISIYFPSSSGTLTTKVNGTGSGDGGNIIITTIPTSSYVNPLNQNVIITGSLTVSGSSTFTNIGPTILSGSVTTTDGFTGSLQGTSSWATNALTASLAPNYVLNSVTSSMLQPYVLTSSTSSMLSPYLLSSQTSSFITNIQTSSFSTGSFTGSFTGSLQGTASWATNALTASLAPNYLLISATGSMLSPYLLSSQTSSFIKNNQTSSFTTTESFNNFTSSINAFTQSILSWTGSVVTNNVFNSFTQSYNTGSFSGSYVGDGSGLTGVGGGISQGKVVAIVNGLANLF